MGLTPGPAEEHVLLTLRPHREGSSHAPSVRAAALLALSVVAVGSVWGRNMPLQLSAFSALEALQPADTLKSGTFLEDGPKDTREPIPPCKVPKRPWTYAHWPAVEHARPDPPPPVPLSAEELLKRQQAGQLPVERGPMGVLWAIPVLASLLFTLRTGMVGILQGSGPEQPAPGGAAPPLEGLPKLPWRPEGWSFWEWRGCQIHYVACKPKCDDRHPRKAPIVLVHGFGASLHHWRYNIPALADAGHPVYALDLLGFGLSDKPLLEYEGTLWRDQLADFVRQVVGEPAVLVGNSLGGYAVLNAAAFHPQVTRAVVLLNIAGRFDADDPADDVAEEDEEPSSLDLVLAGMRQLLMRTVITGSFYVAKQPARIRSILHQVYINRANVDDELVASIAHASRAATAPEVYYRVIHRNWRPNSQATVDALLAMLSNSYRPLLLLWGEMDPWIRPHAGNVIQRLYPKAERVSLLAGHCPQDEVPAVVNAELLAWLDRQRL